jgi:hypothetical protein
MNYTVTVIDFALFLATERVKSIGLDQVLCYFFGRNYIVIILEKARILSIVHRILLPANDHRRKPETDYHFPLVSSGVHGV